MNLWIFHRGALGDSVLLWPAIRRHLLAGDAVTLVADAAKARLAARELATDAPAGRISALDAEHDRFNALWRPDAVHTPIPGVDRVVAWIGLEGIGVERLGMNGIDVAPAASPAALNHAECTWLVGARAMFPGAAIVPAPGRPDRRTALDGQQPAPRHNPCGPIILHAGAGARDKRWPIDRWIELARHLRTSPATAAHAAPDPTASTAPPEPPPAVDLIAGEVEREQWGSAEHAAFRAAGGRFLDDLAHLADALRGARLVLAADSGPGHLAAQLGVATLSIFGPTDPALWAPVGPRARVLAPPTPRAIDWLTVDAVADAIAHEMARA